MKKESDISRQVYETCLELLKNNSPTYSYDDTLRYASKNRIPFKDAFKRLLEGYFIILKIKVSSTHLNDIEQRQCRKLLDELKFAWAKEEI